MTNQGNGPTTPGAADSMADEQPSADQPSGESKSRFASLWQKFRPVRAIGWLLIATVLIHSGLFAWGAWTGRAPATPDAEVALGSFAFRKYGSETSPIDAAQFQLHVSLLYGMDRAGRERLSDRRFKVRQDIEQLLRQAHGGDFDDPVLGELKRQLQETINESLEMRVVEEVIITELSLVRAESPGMPGSMATDPATQSASAAAGP